MSAKKDGPQPSPNGRISNEPPSSPTKAEQFSLSGPSTHPNPRHFAYRKDLADIALAGEVVASHYADPVERQLAREEVLRETAKIDGPPIGQLSPGTSFLMLDDSLGWAWGYAGSERLVGYVPSDALKR